MVHVPHYWPFVRGIHRSPMDSIHIGPLMRRFDISFDVSQCKQLNSREASESRCLSAWWRHEMETFSALLALCTGNSLVTGEFPAQRRVTRSSDILFDLRLNKRLRKQSRGWWFETPWTPGIHVYFKWFLPNQRRKHGYFCTKKLLQE